MKQGRLIIGCLCMVFIVAQCKYSYAELFYFPSEYKKVVDDRDALQITLNVYRDQWEEEKKALKTQIANIQSTDSKKIDELQAQNAKIKADYENQTELVSTLKKVIESQKADLERTTNQANELERQLQAEIRNGDIQIKRLSNKIIININDRISFDSGYSSLKPSVKPALNKIIKILKNYPDNNISIEGHTDNVPIRHCHFQDNWQLSTERALSVLRYILAGSNLDAHRFSAMGYGEYQPRVPNSTPDNRTQNRRVDIIVVPNRNAVSKFN